MTSVEPIEHPINLVQAHVIADLLDCSIDCVYDMAQAGELPHCKVRHRYRFDYDVCLEWIRNGGTAQKKGPSLSK